MEQKKEKKSWQSQKRKKVKSLLNMHSHEGDTGSVEVQVAVLTWEINHLNDHIKQHKKGPRYLPWFDEKKFGHRRNLLATFVAQMLTATVS